MSVANKTLMVFFLWLGVAFSSFALEPVYSDFFGKAIKGYDPVAYFTDAKPTKGDSDYVYHWNDAKWYFSSQENLNAFIAEPEKYAPQYGGYCAWAVAEGYTASIDPDAWRIHDGKLYLNYNKAVQQTWQADIAGNVIRADNNWPKLLKN